MDIFLNSTVAFGLGLITLTVGVGYIVAGTKCWGVLAHQDKITGLVISILGIICMLVSL